MDIALSLVNSNDQELDNLIAEVSKSNIPGLTQSDLIDVLQTIKEQIHQAQAMGWL